MAIVLLVDPSKTIRRVVEMVFKGSGHDIVTATSATEGQQALVRYQPAVAIINYQLPDGSGVELCKLVKANPTTQHVAVVVMGGGYAAFDAGAAESAGAAAVVMKPFKTAELLEPVTELIGTADETLATSPTQPAAPPSAPSAPPQPAQRPAAQVPAAQPASRAVAVPRPRPAERPRYAAPSQAPAAPTTRAPAAVPRPSTPPPAPQAPPPAARPTAAYRGGESGAADVAAESDTTRRVAMSEASAPRPVPAAQPIEVDRDTVRAIVEDLLPQIALDTLQKMLADWLEARLRNYIHELVRQELSRYQRQ